MRYALSSVVIIFYASFPAAMGYAAATGADVPRDALQRGAKAYQLCAACHSLEPGRNLTGPSLANLLGRKAGALADFQRYSEALKKSGVVWNEEALDAWLRDPEKLIPGNEMVFPGIRSDATRRDLIAFLKAADTMPGAEAAAPRLPHLKKAPPGNRVRSIRHCGDTYFVATEDGRMHKLWEFNLRFKTDTSEHGPHPGTPVMIGAGMRGDRASVIFAAPAELGTFVRTRCE